MLKIILFISILLFGWFHISFAQDQKESITIGVYPPLFELNLEQGQDYQNQILLRNKSGLAMPIKVKTADFSALDEAGDIEFNSAAAETFFTDPLEWLRIEKTDFVLEPGKSRQVKFKINVPKEAKQGGYYISVLFEPQLPSHYFADGQVHAVPVISAIFLLSVGLEGSRKSGDLATIVEFNIPENFHLNKIEDAIMDFTGLFSKAQAEERSAFSVVETGELSFALRIKNNDIYHIKPSGKLTIVSNSGQILGETEISKTTILPGKIRRIPADFNPEPFFGLKKYIPFSVYSFLNKNLVWGKYQAKLALTADDTASIDSPAGNKNKTIEQTIEFWVFPWKIAAIFLFLIIAIFLTRKRLIMAGKVLFEPLDS